MSRVAKKPVAVPAGVEVAVSANEISIKGPMGSLKQPLSADVSVVREGDSLLWQGGKRFQARGCDVGYGSCIAGQYGRRR